MGKNLVLAMGILMVSLCKTSAQTSRGPIQVFGGQPDERASTRLLYETNRAIGEFAIDYGRPAWKKEYEDPATFDKMTRGKIWRLGKDFWTTLDTSLLQGSDVNRQGLGARVALLRKNQTPLWRHAHTDGSYLSAQDSRVHFGLGSDPSLQAVLVHWLGGTREVFEDIKPNTIVTLRQQGGKPYAGR